MGTAWHRKSIDCQLKTLEKVTIAKCKCCLTAQAQVPIWRIKIFGQKLISSAKRVAQVPIWRFAIARQFRKMHEKLKNLILYNTTNGKITKRVLPHMRRSEQKVRKYIDGAVSPKAPRQEAARAKGPKQTEVQK